MIEEILNKIEEYDCICLYRHVNPDYDAFGSQFGMYDLIKNTFSNKTVYMEGDFSSDLVQKFNIEINIERKTDPEHLRGSIPRNTYDRSGNVYLLWCHAVPRHYHGYVVCRILYRVDQYRSLHGRDRAGRYLIDRSGTDRRSKSHRYDTLSDHFVCYFPADTQEYHSADRQQPDHQHQGLICSVRYWCYRAVLCGKTDCRCLLLVV